MTWQKSDPKFDYVPKTLMDWMLTQVLYQFMVNTQKFSAKFGDKDDKNYGYY